LKGELQSFEFFAMEDADHGNAIIDAITPFLASSFLGLWNKLNYFTTNGKRLPPHNKSKSYKKQEISPFHPFHF